MAVAYSATGVGTAGLFGGASYTFNHVVTSGDYIVVDCLTDRNASWAAVTCGSVSLSLLGSVTLSFGNSGNAVLRRYGGFTAGSGTQTVTVTSATTQWAVAASVSYSGIVSVGTTTTASGNGSCTQSVTCNSGDVIVQSVGDVSGGALSTGTLSGGTTRYNQSSYNSGSQQYSRLGMRDVTTSTTFTSTTTNYWGALATVLSGSSGTTVTPSSASVAMTGGTPAVSGVPTTLTPSPGTATATGGTPSVGVSGNGVFYDAVGAGSSQNTGSATMSWSHTVAANSYVLVEVTHLPYYSGSISAVTCGGTAMTLLGSATRGTSTDQVTTSFYGLANVTAGSKTISVTTASAGYMSGNSVSLTGVSSVGSVQTTNGNSAAPSHSLTCPANSLLVQSFGARGDSFGASIGSFSGGTYRWDGWSVPALGQRAAASSLSTATADATFAATSLNAQSWVSLGVVFSPAASATPLTPAGGIIAVTGGTPAVSGVNTSVSPSGQSATVIGGTPVVTATGSANLQPSAATITTSGATPRVALPPLNRLLAKLVAGTTAHTLSVTRRIKTRIAHGHNKLHMGRWR